MDKRSFYFLFTILAASMLILGTYKVTKKKNHNPNTHNESGKVIK